MNIMNESVQTDSLSMNSYLYDYIYRCINGFSEHQGISYLSSVNAPSSIFIWLLLFFLSLTAIWLINNFVHWLRYKKRNANTLVNDIVSPLSVLAFLSGMALYFVGYAFGGTAHNFVTLLLRSMTSSLEMFISKSNLIGIAPNCRNSTFYMFCFVCTHTMAISVSIIFTVSCLWKRIVYWLRALSWIHFNNSTSSILHIFWGINERSVHLASDIYQKGNKKERIIFIDLPSAANPKEDYKKGGLVGLRKFNIELQFQLQA